MSRPFGGGVLDGAIETYNEYHDGMATADLRERSDEGFVVAFEGPFCRTCCDYDYFEDLIYELAERGVDPSTVTIDDVEYRGDERFCVAFGLE